MMRDLDLLVRDNTPDIFYDCLQTLLLIVNNILQNPSEIKYQRIPLAAKKFTDTVLKAKNGFEFLLDCGFQRQVFEFKGL